MELSAATLTVSALIWLALFIPPTYTLTVKLCVPYPDGSSEKFLRACTNAIGLANTAELTFECVKGGTPDKCIDQIVRGNAHLTALDGGDVLTAHRKHGIQPLILERSGDGVQGGTYYAVAVVNKDFCTDTTTLADLKGVDSCHTGYRKTAGWMIPAGALMTYVEDYLSKPELFDVEIDAQVMANFFGNVCAPRTSGLGPKHGSGGVGVKWDPLCDGCKGNCSTKDQYYNYAGAFRCLMEGKGDVAFVKHTTVTDYALSGNAPFSKHAWADRTADEFRLLCPGGGCKKVTEYKDCHLALAPGHALVTSRNLGYGGNEENIGFEIGSAFIEASRFEEAFLIPTTGLRPGFLWSEGTIGVGRAILGIDSYLPKKSREIFDAYDALETRAINSGPPGGVYCATSAEESSFCLEMTRSARRLVKGVEWGCEIRETKEECMELIVHGLADWMTAGPKHAYIASTDYDLTAIVANDGDMGGGYDYYAVAIVRSEFCGANGKDVQLLDLKGAKSCHTGYRRNAGWDITIGRMVEMGLMESVRDDPFVQNDAETVAAFFSESCVPSGSVIGPLRTENGSMTTWEPLCGLCEDSCDADSPFAGYEGAFECIRRGAGDVAFVKHTTPEDFMDPSDITNYQLICPGSNGCHPLQDYLGCNFGHVPAQSVVVRNLPSHTDTFKDLLLTLLAMPEFIEGFMTEENNPESYIFRINTPLYSGIDGGTKAFLGSVWGVYEALENLNAPSGEQVKVCIPYKATSSKIGRCGELFKDANIEGVIFECVEGGTPDACLEMLFRGQAQMTALNTGDVYRGYKVYGLEPILVEDNEANFPGNYYAVAVVNKEFCNKNTTLNDLEGVRSCHTGYRKMAGWRVPVGTLFSEVDAFRNEASVEDVEDDAELVARFFSGTCAPRVSGGGPRRTEDGIGELWSPLCTQCKGNCLQNDQYYDYRGALRCLMEDSGDVAFVRHDTVLNYAKDGEADSISKAWADKPMSDFRLLCREGGCEEVHDYRDCHLALIPNHAIVVAPELAKSGARSDVGVVIREGLAAAVDIPEFFDSARGFIQGFPFTSTASGLVELNDGYEDYITRDAEKTLEVFSELTSGEKRTNTANIATFCASSPKQYAACKQNLNTVFRKVDRDLEWACMEETSVENCVLAVRRGVAQFMSASASDAFTAYKEFDLQVILSEVIGDENEEHVHSLLIVKNEICSYHLFITGLEDEDFCFPGVDDAAGWQTPIGTMIAQGFLRPPTAVTEENNAVQSVSDFFGKICAPHDPESDGASETLCEGCKGECGLDSPYYGALGAVKCLRDTEATAAITDSSILTEKSSLQGLRLLCPNRRACHDVDSYESCNFGATPTDVILVDGTATNANVSKLRTALLTASVHKHYMSILGITRSAGELVAVAGDTSQHFKRYAFTNTILEDFNRDQHLDG